MTMITLDDIRANPEKFIDRMEAGETLVVYREDRPVAEIRPVPSDNDETRLRPFGLCAGEFTVPDEFDDPLTEDILL